MLHNLTLGHLDPEAVSNRMAVVLRPLEEGIVGQILRQLGERDAEGRWRLGGRKVELRDGYVVVPWLGGGANCVSEEFALRLHRVTGCLLADREHGRIIAPEQLKGLDGRTAATQAAGVATSERVVQPDQTGGGR